MHHDDANRTAAESAICSEPLRAELLSLVLDAVNVPMDLVLAVRLLHEGSRTPLTDIATTSGVPYAAIQMLLGNGAMSLSKTQLLRLVRAMGVSDAAPWERAWSRSARCRVSPVVLVSAPTRTGEGTEYESSASSSAVTPRDSGKFVEQFRSQALTQSSKTFHVALCFTIATGLTLLASIAVTLYAVFNDASGLAASATITAISLVLTTFGAAVTAWASQARTHLTRQAERVERSTQADRAFLQAGTVLDRVEDPELRDELRKATIAFALGRAAAEISDTTPIAPLEPAHHRVGRHD